MKKNNVDYFANKASEEHYNSNGVLYHYQVEKGAYQYLEIFANYWVKEHIPRLASIKDRKSLIDKDDVIAHFKNINPVHYTGLGSTKRSYLISNKKVTKEVEENKD